MGIQKNLNIEIMCLCNRFIEGIRIIFIFAIGFKFIFAIGLLCQYLHAALYS